MKTPSTKSIEKTSSLIRSIKGEAGIQHTPEYEATRQEEPTRQEELTRHRAAMRVNARETRKERRHCHRPQS